MLLVWFPNMLAEMAKHPMAAHFAMLDADKNGYLSPKEAAAHGL